VLAVALGFTRVDWNHAVVTLSKARLIRYRFPNLRRRRCAEAFGAAPCGEGSNGSPRSGAVAVARRATLFM